MRSELGNKKLPTSAEGVRVMVIGEDDPVHTPAVVRTAAGAQTGLAPGADISVSGPKGTMDKLVQAHPQSGAFNAAERRIAAGNGTLDDLATQGAIGAHAHLDRMRLALADARGRLPTPSESRRPPDRPPNRGHALLRAPWPLFAEQGYRRADWTRP